MLQRKNFQIEAEACRTIETAMCAKPYETDENSAGQHEPEAQAVDWNHCTLPPCEQKYGVDLHGTKFYSIGYSAWRCPHGLRCSQSFTSDDPAWTTTWSYLGPTFNLHHSLSTRRREATNADTGQPTAPLTATWSINNGLTQVTQTFHPPFT